MAVQTSLKKQLDPLCPIASLGGSVPEFVRKPIAICDFPGEVGSGPFVPLSRSGHVLNMIMCWESLDSQSF